MENNNPYKVHDPYQSNNSHQKNTDNNFKKMVKEKAKDDAKKAFDKILQNYQNAKNNGLILEKDYENIGNIIRYYNKHYLGNYIAFLFFLGVVSFFASFLTKLSVFAILIGLILNIIYSKKLYLKTLFYTHSVDSKVQNDIYNYIFSKSDFKIFVIFSFFLFAVSTIVSYFTKVIFLTKFEDIKFIQILTKNFPSFDINNELFAYSILLSFISLIIFKIIKK